MSFLNVIAPLKNGIKLRPAYLIPDWFQIASQLQQNNELPLRWAAELQLRGPRREGRKGDQAPGLQGLWNKAGGHWAGRQAGPHTVSCANFFAQGADFELFNCASIFLARADVGNQRIKALDENGLQFSRLLFRAGRSPGSLGDGVHRPPTLLHYHQACHPVLGAPTSIRVSFIKWEHRAPGKE